MSLTPMNLHDPRSQYSSSNHQLGDCARHAALARKSDRGLCRASCSCNAREGLKLPGHMSTTHFLKMLRRVFSFELSSVPLSGTEVDTIGAASVEAVEDATDEGIESLFFADGPEDEDAMIEWRVDRLLGVLGKVEMLMVAVPARYGYRSPSDVRVIESRVVPRTLSIRRANIYAIHFGFERNSRQIRTASARWVNLQSQTAFVEEDPYPCTHSLGCFPEPARS